MSFKINEFEQQVTIPILTIKLIGHFSIDGNLQYHGDLSQLKYLIRPSDPDNINFNLAKNYTSIHFTSHLHMKLDNILKWICDNYQQIDRPFSIEEDRWLNIDFICSRGVIKKILSSPYSNNEDWIIYASKYRGTIYLCQFYSDEKEFLYSNKTRVNKIFASYGCKFEQYMFADHPSGKPNPTLPLNENEKFYCMFKANFDNHSLLYGAEIDGIISEEPITDTLVGKKMELIELKTYRTCKLNIQNKIPDRIAVQWWCQNYAVQIKKIICGFKNAFGSVTKIIEYSDDDLLQFSNCPIDVNECKIACKMFLDNVKKIVTKNHNECMYKFKWKWSIKNIVSYSEEAPDDEKFLFVKPWFVEKVEKYRCSE